MLDTSILDNNLNDQILYNAFFKALGYKETDTVYLRTFKDKGEKDNGQNLEVPLSRFEAVCPVLRERNAEDRGIFFVVNGGGQQDRNVKTARAQFIDFDDFPFEEQLRRLNGFPLEPSMIVKTKKSLHCYWILDNGDISVFREIQKRLIQYFGSDPSIKNESRVMRLPGFEHRKTDKPVMVKLIKFDPYLRYTQRQLHENLPLLKKQNAPEGKTHKPENRGPIPVGERHNYVIRVIGDIVARLGNSVSAESILAMAESDFRENCQDPDQTDDDFRRKYLPEIRKFQERHEAEAKDPGFYSYALDCWKAENPGKEFNKEVVSWQEIREVGERWKQNDKKILTTTKSGKIVPAGKQQKPQKLKSISAAELDRIELPEIFYPIEGLVPEGVTVIAAPPKSGKSWMVLDMALSVANGKSFLGQFKTQKCDVLYLDLEDGPKFGQERLRKLCPDEEIPENLHYIFEGAVPLDEGFIDQLEELRADIPNLGLVIIDTLRFIACRPKKNESAYSCDYRTGQTLKTWCDKYGLSIIEVTHTTKLIHPDDALANVSGTNGVTGAADAVLVIAKDKRTSTEAVLAVDGRRVKQTEYDLRINWDLCRWEYIGISDADERERQARQRMIEELRSSTAYKAALKIANHYVKGWKGTARNLIDEATDFGIFVTESPKEVGGMLSSNKNIFAQDGVKIEYIKNGTGPKFYRLSSWEDSKEGDTLFNYH